LHALLGGEENLDGFCVQRIYSLKLRVESYSTSNNDREEVFDGIEC
jgi:hypothetical protein